MSEVDNQPIETIKKDDRFTDADGWRWAGPPGGESCIGPTTILSNAVANPKLSQWYKKTSEKKIYDTMEKAANFGTEAHEIFEKIMLGQNPEVPATHRVHVNAFNKWRQQNEVEPMHLEKRVVSLKLGVDGTCDFIGKINGKVCVADWKTGRNYSITAGWQMAFYRLAAIEMGLVDETCGIVGLQIARDTGVPKAFVYEHIDFVEQMFLCSLQLFKGLYFNKLNKLNWKWLKERAI